ncbi:hypothetical protein [Marivirga harenae]|uniref:hypothetical protein n=1 Tax=Marivirga harenae TaxID=2010992 RepID=UPI0026DF4847|nr:hypothetical protein [Marivirga harenae]WKV10939.1 hypothetical protein Q3Y49_12020 [Marivirga harenae]
MRFISLLLIALIFHSDKIYYENFSSKFPSFKWDESGNYLTRHLNEMSFLDFEKEYELLTDSEYFYYACNQDSSRLYY